MTPSASNSVSSPTPFSRHLASLPCPRPEPAVASTSRPMVSCYSRYLAERSTDRPSGAPRSLPASPVPRGHEPPSYTIDLPHHIIRASRKLSPCRTPLRGPASRPLPSASPNAPTPLQPPLVYRPISSRGNRLPAARLPVHPCPSAHAKRPYGSTPCPPLVPSPTLSSRSAPVDWYQRVTFYTTPLLPPLPRHAQPLKNGSHLLFRHESCSFGLSPVIW